MSTQKRYYSVEDALEFVLDGDVSDLESSSDEELDFYRENSRESLDVICETSGESSEEEIPTQSAPKRSKSNDFNWVKSEFAAPNVDFDMPTPEPPVTDMPPYHYFKYFITTEMLESAAYQANLYSVQKDSKTIDTNKVELEHLISIILRMGLAQMTNVRCYWELDKSYHLVSDVMSRTRFEKLMARIHFEDNNSVPDNEKLLDKLWKIRPWLLKLREQFLKISPEEYQAVDEIMVPFKGRSYLKQYMPGKPHKWGFKIWGRCSSSGFLHDFEVYQGKRQGAPKPSECGMGGDVVRRLVSTLPVQKKFKIFTDNFFTSIPLVQQLKEDGHHFIGTIRANRLKGCSLLSDKELKKSGRGSWDYKVLQDDNIVAVRWFDRKGVNLVSTFVGVEPHDQVSRYSQTEHRPIQVNRPSIVKMYNQYMGGIDKLDQMCSLYKAKLKSKRWYIYIWLHTIMIAVVNGWIIYRRHRKVLGDQKHMPLRDFIAATASSLLSFRKTCRGRPSDELLSVGRGHTIVQASTSEDVAKDRVDHLPVWEEKRQRCKNCPGRSSFSYVKCTKCNVFLCLNKDRNCFKSYHE